MPRSNRRTRRIACLVVSAFAAALPAATAQAQVPQPEQITVKGGQTVTTKTVFKKGATYKVEVSGSLTQPLSDGGTHTIDAFYQQSSSGPNAGAPTRGGGITGRAWGYNDTFERYTVNRTVPAYSGAHAYVLTWDRVEDGTMDLIAASGNGGFTVKITPPAAAPPAPPEVTLSNVSRKVEVSRNESGWEPATNGMKLRSGDRVHTGFKAGVTMTFPDGSTARVEPMSLVHLADLSVAANGGLRVRLWLRLGEVKTQVNRSTGARGDFEVKTPTTTASIRGTIFSVFYDGTATTVAVSESSVEVTANNGAKVVVPAGMEVRSTATSVSPPAAIGKGFRSGGLSAKQALERISSKLAAGLKRCRLGVVSTRLAPVTGGWSAKLVIVRSSQGIEAKPRGTAVAKLKGTRVSPQNPLAKRIARGCR